jgi:hypothetical protein
MFDVVCDVRALCVRACVGDVRCVYGSVVVLPSSCQGLRVLRPEVSSKCFGRAENDWQRSAGSIVCVPRTTCTRC